MPKGGHNRFTPTQEQRAQVEALRAYGAPLEDICLFVRTRAGDPISLPTLRKHFSVELRMGKWKIVTTVAQTLVQSAKGAPAQFDAQGKQTRAERPPDTVAGIFITKALGGWVDRHQTQHADANGKPLPAGMPAYIAIDTRDKKL